MSGALKMEARDEAHYFDGVGSLEAHGHDRCAHHGCLQRGEEWFTYEVSVVLIKYFVVQLHHFHANDAQSFFLKAAGDFANQGSHHCARFEQHQCSFHFVAFLFVSIFPLRKGRFLRFRLQRYDNFGR